jgi:hypothetical protein
VNGPVTRPDPHRQLGLACRAFAAGFYRMKRLLWSIPNGKARKEQSFPAHLRVTTEACKTASVTGPDVVQRSTPGSGPSLGAASRAREELGPISPELALVDHVLAERARALLPEPREQSMPRPTSIPVTTPSAPISTEAARPRPRRWRRTAALAALVFVAGAASGGLLARKDGPASRVRLELQGGTRTPLTDAGQPNVTQRGSADERTQASPQQLDDRPAPTEAKRRAAVRRTWAPNVLGVTAGVDSKGVKLVWERPHGSDHVVVLRALSSRRKSVVVFRGRATTYRDVSARPCSEYRYTIVNYDRLRHPSTGVPTSVVTQGCA